MIQFNLLPDVKLEYVKAQRTKRLVVVSAMIATASAFAVFLLLLIAVQGVQRKSINDLNGDIKQKSAELKATPDLNKILTIQNQLNSVNDLHEQKVAAARIFTLLQQVTPADVTISNHTTDFEAQTMTITGEAPSLDRVNTFVDTLKFAAYSGGGDDARAFSSVVLTQFGRTESDSTYTLDIAYDPILFTGDQSAALVVPQTVTTRSVQGQPTDIFKKTDTGNGQGN